MDHPYKWFINCSFVKGHLPWGWLIFLPFLYSSSCVYLFQLSTIELLEFVTLICFESWVNYVQIITKLKDKQYLQLVANQECHILICFLDVLMMLHSTGCKLDSPIELLISDGELFATLLQPCSSFSNHYYLRIQTFLGGRICRDQTCWGKDGPWLWEEHSHSGPSTFFFLKFDLINYLFYGVFHWGT